MKIKRRSNYFLKSVFFIFVLNVKYLTMDTNSIRNSVIGNSSRFVMLAGMGGRYPYFNASVLA